MNRNYNPLQHEHRSLHYYFKELFNLMDKYQDAKVAVYHLLDKYLAFENKQFHGRMIESTELAAMMKETIRTQSIEQALNLLNNRTYTIDPNDDLIWLLSALYSVFPHLYIKLTNQAILNALTIHDINDIYLQNIIKKFITNERFVLTHQSENHEIAHLTGQYESLARHYAKDFTDEDWCKNSLALNELDKFLKYATVEQAENIILPVILTFLNPEIKLLEEKNAENVHTRIWKVLEKLPCLIDKISPKAIQTKLLPQLLVLYNKQEDKYVHLGKAFLHCIAKMNVDALKSDLLPVFMSAYFAPEKKLNNALAQEPLIALISKLNIDESNQIAEQITPTVGTYYPFAAEKKLNFLKELRLNQGYVNEKLFHVFYKQVHDSNEAFIHELISNVKSNTVTLCAKHLTADQVQRILTVKPYQQLPGYVFGSLASLPNDVYILEQRKSVFEFLFEKRYEKNYLNSLTESLKYYDFSDQNGRKSLIDLFNIASTKINAETSDHVGSDKGYYPLLETCISRMNESEIKEHVVPFINMNKISDFHYAKNMHETFRILATNTNDIKIILSFYAKFAVAYMTSARSEYKDLLDILTKKMPPEALPYLIRAFLKNDFEDNRLNHIAYVLTLIYNRNKELYGNVQHFCKGTEYRGEVAEQKCALM